MIITMAHGSGGQATSALIQEIFAAHFHNPILAKMEDAAVVPGSARLAITTDSFVVTPLFFPGGDIGRLAVCGTVNDLLMSGASPQYLTCGFILEEGADTRELEQIAASMAAAAKEAKIQIVAGDTKVIEGRGSIYINTSGVGFVPQWRELGASQCESGDVILVSGSLGDHHAAILSARMGIENPLQSDCAPLNEMVEQLFARQVRVKAMRDITRGGLATILHEYAQASSCCMEIQETALPVSPQVKSFCSLLGLDPLYMGNEGKMLAVVKQEDAELALSCLQNSPYGAKAAIIGRVTDQEASQVLLHTRIGGTRMVGELIGEGLPRIC